MSPMDLIISVDTERSSRWGYGKAHMGIAVLCHRLALARNREDSPRHPIARLFRQRELGDWDSVIERVTRELRERFG